MSSSNNPEKNTGTVDARAATPNQAHAIEQALAKAPTASHQTKESAEHGVADSSNFGFPDLLKAKSLEGILSDKAVKQLEGVLKEVKSGAQYIQKEGHIKTATAEEFLDKKLEKAAGIILNDLDKTDSHPHQEGTISKAAVEDKLIRAASVLNKLSGSDRAIAAVTLLHLETAVNQMPDTVKVEEVQGKFNTRVEGLVHNIVKNFDINQDGVLDKKDKIAFLFQSGSFEHRDVQNTSSLDAPSTPNAKPQTKTVPHK